MTTFFRITDAPTSNTGRTSWLDGAQRSSPTDGGFVHGVGASDIDSLPASGGAPAFPGMIYRVEAAESFSSGVDLATTSAGQVRVASAGDVKVGEALESASGSGDVIWVVMATQRTL